VNDHTQDLPLYPLEREAWYPLNRRVGESQSQYEHFEEWKDLLLLPQFEVNFFQLIVSNYTG
jgi:hypothetical protein